MDACDSLFSVVVTSRNDNHGGTLLRRMQTFVNGFVGQCKRHNLAAELIIVEWNPPADKPPLVEALQWPADLGPCVVRVITVPHEIHARMRHSAALPLFQMIAKNVGIRRARGAFVLATNIDILFSDELMEYLTSGQLEAGRLYRLDRHDVATEVPVDGSVEEQLAFCRNNLLRLNARAGTVRLTPDGRVCPEYADVFGEGEFYLDRDWNPPDRWSSSGKPSRWLKKETALTLRAPDGPRRALRLTLISGPAVGFAPFDLEVLDDSGALVARGRVESDPRQFDVTLPLRPGEIGRFRFVVPLPLVPDPDAHPGIERALCMSDCRWAPVGACDAVPQPGGLNFADVARPPAPEIAPEGAVLLGRGWIPFHTYNGQPIHWATREATLVVMPQPAGPRPLRLVLSRDVSGEEFGLEVVDESGAVVASGRVESGRPILLDLPTRPDRSATFRFRVRDEVAAGADGWERAFRLYSCGWGGDEYAVSRPEWLRFAVVTDPPPPPAPPPPPLWYRAARRLGRSVLALGRGSRTPAPASAAVETTPSAKEIPAAEAPAATPADARAVAPAAGPVSMPVTNVPPADLHINACGDFTLLARSDWFDLRANPEWEVFSLHIDSMMCHIAYNAGLEEVVLPEPMRIYHIEHGTGSGWTPEGETRLLERINQLGIPVLTWDQLYRWGADMRELKSPMIFNGPDWGLARETLPETVLRGVSRAAA